jgi:alpha-L-fucosidase
MKKIYLFIALLFCSIQVSFGQNYQPTQEILQAREKFNDYRFGIFLHWGIYSMFAQGEWYMTNKQLDCEEYAKAANAFYPHQFNANEWVEAIKEAGARYICFTSRHHDGFSMWNTQVSDYNIMNTPFKRDVIKELAEACHNQDMALHLYYSHIDWTRPDYPRGRTGQRTCKNLQPDWNNYYRFMNEQLTELLTNYGKIGAIWFDGWWDHDEDSIPFDWQLDRQYALIHQLQPSCLVGNNHHQTPFEGEDIQIFERDVPGENKAGLSGQSISRLPLETCQTMNGMWGYKVEDQNYKSTNELIRLLARTAGKGANLLLNIGPQPDGQLPETALNRLSEIGQWLKLHGESIYGTDAGDFKQGEEIVTTQKDNLVYVHILTDTIKEVKIPMKDKVKNVYKLDDKSALQYKQKDDTLTFSTNIPSGTADQVIVIELKKKK